MWRWSQKPEFYLIFQQVFSTYVEVILCRWIQKPYYCSILHVCGGDPFSAQVYYSFKLYSPRMWRWSLIRPWCSCLNSVFSTYVEVILSFEPASWSKLSILHVCGGDPGHGRKSWVKLLYSPRMWRWSFFQLARMHDKMVFSTYVEVIPNSTNSTNYCTSILHVCGGDPIVSLKVSFNSLYSPRMWRWSLAKMIGELTSDVFSTYVEVIPNQNLSLLILLGILHVCGGDP